MANQRSIFGLLAEYNNEEALMAAAHQVRLGGYRRTDAFSPYPVHGLAAAIGFKRTRMPLITFLGGAIGGIGGFFMQWYANVVSYPEVIAGRPFNSWPTWIPITFELTVLGASFAAFFGMLGRNGLPMPYHPLFNVPRFSLASRDRFFICIEAADPKFSIVDTRRFLEGLKPLAIYDVPA